jgi:Cytochrome c7 and related cytochrome c
MFRPPHFKILSSLFLIILFLSFFTPGYAYQSKPSGSAIFQKRTFKTEEVIRGERLFYGLVYLDDKSINCAGCHNTGFSDTLNWNPDAVEISKKYISKSAGDLSKVLLSPSGQKISLAHKDFNLTPEDIVLIKAYMDMLPSIGLKQSKPVLTNTILFIIASLLLLFSTIDILITKKIKRRWVNVVLLLFSSVFITRSLIVDAIAIGHSPGYEPDQPVKFSHAVHAGQNRTDCIYCHSYAPYSKTAGFPAENICMNCHLLVRTGTRSGVFEITKVISAYENKKPIEWIKVHNLPDHVFFSHAQHVTAGEIACQECHGPVEKMGRIKLASDLTMGWCINCHRSRNVNFNNNRFYTEYTGLAEKIRNRETDSINVKMIGGTECMKCHY